MNEGRVGQPPHQRVAVVSGGSSGIGRAIAEAFGAQGWAVAVGSRREARVREAVSAVRDAGGKAFGAALDVCDADSIDDFYAASEASLGPADLIVGCAAHARPGRLDEKSPEQIRGEIETGLIGALLFARRGLRALRTTGRPGDVVFISSASADTPWPMLTAYAASKAGIEQAARSLALELDGTGIRSLVVRVGNTVGTEWAVDWGVDASPHFQTWQRLGLLRHGGFLQPSQVAEAVVAAVKTARDVHLDFVSVQPGVPVDGSGDS